MRSVMRTFSEGTQWVKQNTREKRVPVTRIGGARGDNSLMFMTQNASVEAVTARRYNTETNDFMSRVWRG